MSCKSTSKKIKQFLSTFDMFSQPVSLRYKQHPQYQTATGGVCTIIIIMIFVGIFFVSGLNTINKVDIFFTLRQYQEDDPSYYTTSGSSDFLFAVGIEGIDLNQGQRYFDITMQFINYFNGTKNKIYLPLQKCEKSQWQAISSNIGESYDRLGFDKYLCPTKDLVIQLQGKYTSQVFKFFKFAVNKCNPALNPSRPCVADSVINSYVQSGQLYNFNFYFLSTIINPGTNNVITKYLQDRNYFPFSPNNGIIANLFISSYQVQTDQSLFPYEDLQSQIGGTVIEKASNFNFQVTNSEYLRFYLRKSSTSRFYQRSFKKIDETLSYIGGLFSALISVLVITIKFTQYSYELDMLKALYYQEKNKKYDSDSFNMLVFLGYLIYKGFFKICIQLPWQRMKKIHQSLGQIRQQLDLRFILKKLNYVQQAIKNVILPQHQSSLLHLMHPLLLQQAKQNRLKYKRFCKLKKKYIENKKIQQKKKATLVESTMQDINKIQESNQSHLQQQDPMIYQFNEQMKKLQKQTLSDDKISLNVMKQIDTFFKEIYLKNMKLKLINAVNIKNSKKASNQFDDEFEFSKIQQQQVKEINVLINKNPAFIIKSNSQKKQSEKEYGQNF